jgi:hypothetical protein
VKRFGEAAAQARGLAEISRVLGLRGVEWEMPGLGLMWQFTNEEGITFYTRSSADLGAVRERLEEKIEEFWGQRSFAA